MSIVKRTVLAAGSLLTIAAMQLPAHADTLYDWSLFNPPTTTGAGGVTALSGTLEANDTTGAVDGITVTGFTNAVLSPTYGDNLVYPANNSVNSLGGYLDQYGGLEFTYGTSNTDVLIYYAGCDTSGSCDNDYFEVVNGGDALAGQFTLTATPLPASWSMILSGLAFVAFFAYRRSSKAGNIFA